MNKDETMYREEWVEDADTDVPEIARVDSRYTAVYDDMKNFAGNIFAYVHENGITPDQAKKIFEISNETYNRWKHGASLPESETLKKIKEKLNLSEEDMFNENGHCTAEVVSYDNFFDDAQPAITKVHVDPVLSDPLNSIGIMGVSRFIDEFRYFDECVFVVRKKVKATDQMYFKDRPMNLLFVKDKRKEGLVYFGNFHIRDYSKNRIKVFLSRYKTFGCVSQIDIYLKNKNEKANKGLSVYYTRKRCLSLNLRTAMKRHGFVNYFDFAGFLGGGIKDYDIRRVLFKGKDDGKLVNLIVDKCNVTEDWLLHDAGRNFVDIFPIDEFVSQYLAKRIDKETRIGVIAIDQDKVDPQTSFAVQNPNYDLELFEFSKKVRTYFIIDTLLRLREIRRQDICMMIRKEDRKCFFKWVSRTREGKFIFSDVFSPFTTYGDDGNINYKLAEKPEKEDDEIDLNALKNISYEELSQSEFKEKYFYVGAVVQAQVHNI